MRTWSHKGIPEYPKAWLRKVAQNLMLEHFRRKKIFVEKITPELGARTQQIGEIEITDKIIEDSQLHMMFVLCDNALNKESQICIALRILCGFSIEEIASGTFIKQRNNKQKIIQSKKSN